MQLRTFNQYKYSLVFTFVLYAHLYIQFVLNFFFFFFFSNFTSFVPQALLHVIVPALKTMTRDGMKSFEATHEQGTWDVVRYI